MTTKRLTTLQREMLRIEMSEFAGELKERARIGHIISTMVLGEPGKTVGWAHIALAYRFPPSEPDMLLTLEQACRTCANILQAIGPPA